MTSLSGSGTTFKGGTLVLPGGSLRADVGVDESGRIAAIGDLDPVGTVVDTTDLLVFPGMVDTHVHLMDPGPTEREDFPTGTRAAAARGVTSIIEHTHSHPIREAADLADKKRQLEGRSNVDYGLAAHVWPDRIGRLGELWAEGISFFKIFTCTTHGVPGLDPASLLSALRQIASFDGACLVHCEDETITADAEVALREAGREDGGLVIDWRNREAELVATAMTLALAGATGVRATVAHVSHPAVAAMVTEARQGGADVAAEACPQYFALDEDEVRTEGPFRKFTPPARVRNAGERDEMWAAVRSGAFSHFSTDHAPSTREQKEVGSIWDAPFGLPGLDTTFPFLLDAALVGTITPEDVARMYSETPARRYGLAPSKGRLTEGADADIVLVDPADSWTVSDGDIVSKAGWSPYAGRTFKGRVLATYLRGTEIARDGVCHDDRTGSFVKGAGL